MIHPMIFGDQLEKLYAAENVCAGPVQSMHNTQHILVDMYREM